MMKREQYKRIAAVPMIAGLLLSITMLTAQPAQAAGEKQITLTCTQDETILTGMEWRLYRVGTRDGAAVSFIPELADYSLDLGDLSAEAVDTAAKTLEGYITAAQLAPVAEGETDTNGELVFGGLENGLYLAVGKSLQVQEIIYYPSALLLEVNNADTALSYDAYPKFYAENSSSGDTMYMVKKVWVDDDDAAQERPTSVTVDLYQDGKLADTVTLNETNNWQYRWEALDDASEWVTVEREIPVHYEVMIDRNMKQFLIRNTYKAPASVTTAATTAPPETVTTAVTKEPAKLIQTGQLWWPVVPLTLGGGLLIGAGLSARRKKRGDEA